MAAVPAPRRRRWRRQGAAPRPSGSQAVTREVALQPSGPANGARQGRAGRAGSARRVPGEGGACAEARAAREGPLGWGGGRTLGGKGRGPHRAASVRLLKIFHSGCGRQGRRSAGSHSLRRYGLRRPPPLTQRPRDGDSLDSTFLSGARGGRDARDWVPQRGASDTENPGSPGRRG